MSISHLPLTPLHFDIEEITLVMLSPALRHTTIAARAFETLYLPIILSVTGKLLLFIDTQNFVAASAFLILSA